MIDTQLRRKPFLEKSRPERIIKPGPYLPASQRDLGNVGRQNFVRMDGWKAQLLTKNCEIIASSSINRQ